MRALGLGLAFFLLSSPNTLFGAMSSPNYRVDWDAVNVGGIDTGSSASYILRDEIGGFAGTGSSNSFQLDAGYRPGIFDEIIAATYLVQNNASEVAATAVADTTVTVTTALDFAANDYIILVQDAGATQVSAMGKVISTTAVTITVDVWTTNGVMPVIDGAGDLVYKLDGAAIGLGTLTPASVSTAVVGWEISADIGQGYGIYIFEDANPMSGLTSFTDVADGAVSAGNTEFGARSSDGTLSSTFDTQDTAITSVPQIVASRSDNAFESRDFLTVKASVANDFTGGAYTGSFTFVLTGDY